MGVGRRARGRPRALPPPQPEEGRARSRRAPLTPRVAHLAPPGARRRGRGVRVSSVSAGKLHALALTDDGEAYGWGCADERLGMHGHLSARHYRPPTRYEGFRCARPVTDPLW